MRILSSLILLLLCISCNQANIDSSSKILQDYKSEEDFSELRKTFKSLSIEYKELLEEYKVFGEFLPSDVFTISENEIILDGSVLLAFKKDDKEFNVKHDYFRLSFPLPSKNCSLQDFDSIKRVTIEEGFPFWFQDANFDGNKELVIPQYGNFRQRSSNYISFYDISEELAKPLKGLPYDEIDDLMFDKVLDERAKTITIFDSGGWCENSESIYKKNAKGDFALEYYIDYKEVIIEDSTRCRKDTYDSTMKLIKSEFTE